MYVLRFLMIKYQFFKLPKYSCKLTSSNEHFMISSKLFYKQYKYKLFMKIETTF